MKISIVIPVHQRQRQAEAAIASALLHNVDDFEIIIVDDGSPTAFVLPPELAANSRIKLIQHPHNQGAAAARNTGLAEAKGEWLAFLDSDDVWMPGKLDAQLAFARADDRANSARHPTVYATGFVLDNTGTGDRRTLFPVESNEPADFASGCWFAPGSTALIRRDAAALIGPMDPRPGRLEDLDWFLRMSLLGGRLRVAPVLGATIATGHKPDLRVLERAIAVLSAKWLAPGSADRLASPLRRRMSAYFDLERASLLWRTGRWALFAFHMARSLATVPRNRAQLKDWWRPVPPT
jgi:glycosyltransferase involved in cell wall biosynthesis